MIDRTLEHWFQIHSSSIGTLKSENGTQFNELKKMDYQFYDHPSHIPQHNSIAERVIGVTKKIYTAIIFPLKAIPHAEHFLHRQAWKYATTIKNRWYHSHVEDIPLHSFL